MRTILVYFLAGVITVILAQIITNIRIYQKKNKIRIILLIIWPIFWIGMIKIAIDYCRKGRKGIEKYFE